MDVKTALQHGLDECEGGGGDPYSAIRKLAARLGVFVSMWGRDDIGGEIEGHGYEPTDERIDEVMDEMDSRQDATLGIDWDFIGVIIDGVSAGWGKPDLEGDDEE